MTFVLFGIVQFFFFKQKTAYEMRISDWSSDVCSSDLEFKMVDMNADPAELVKGNAPIGDEIVPYPGNPMGIPVIAVKRAAIIEGGQLVDARQSYEPQT